MSTVSSFETVDSNDVLQIKGGYFTRTRIVHTGLRVNEIRDVDLEKQRFFMDFDIWFRYRGELDTGAIEFPNAAEAVQLGTPVLRTACSTVCTGFRASSKPISSVMTAASGNGRSAYRCATGTSTANA